MAERDTAELPRWIDLTLALSMALAAVGTAWAGFQSAKWSGEQANSYAQAGASRTDANRAATRAASQRVSDVVTFTTWLTALQQEIIDGRSPMPRGDYQPTKGTLSGFLFSRLRDEFRPAIDAWLATRPLLIEDAPSTPFEMREYRLAAETQSNSLAVKADRLSATARESNQRSDNYV